MIMIFTNPSSEKDNIIVKAIKSYCLVLDILYIQLVLAQLSKGAVSGVSNTL